MKGLVDWAQDDTLALLLKHDKQILRILSVDEIMISNFATNQKIYVEFFDTVLHEYSEGGESNEAPIHCEELSEQKDGRLLNF